MNLYRGRTEKLAYSLSRWTDVVASKWPWFLACLDAGEMVGIDQRTGVPTRWSLRPEDTHGLVFWTKDPRNLLSNRELLTPFQVRVHMTVTGWQEVEKGAPTLEEALPLLEAASRAYGPENVTWRFSPVPLLETTEVVSRFARIAATAQRAGLRNVFVAFLQENDRLPETRTVVERNTVLMRLAEAGRAFGVNVRLCFDDRVLLKSLGAEAPGGNLTGGICAPPSAFSEGEGAPAERCGCAMMVDPFTINEACTFGCAYCYAADETLSGKKRNTTRRLQVVR